MSLFSLADQLLPALLHPVTADPEPAQPAPNGDDAGAYYGPEWNAMPDQSNFEADPYGPEWDTDPYGPEWSTDLYGPEWY